MPDRTPLHAAIRESTDPVALFDRVVRQCLELVPHADGASLEMRRDAAHLEYVSAAGTLAEFVGLRLPVDQSLSGLAARTGQVQHAEDARSDARVNIPAVAATGVVSMLCVPLIGDHRNTAVLKVSSRIPHAFDAADAHTLLRLAGFLSTAVHAASLMADIAATALAETSFAQDSGSIDEDSATRMARFVANVMRPGLTERVDAANAIADIIENDGLSMVLQPVVDLATGAIRGFEALARFSDTTLAVDEAFALAHAVGRGIEFELLAVRKAIVLLHAIPEPFRMSLNIGAAAAVAPTFAALLADAPVHRLTIEITEHTAIADYAFLNTSLEPLRQRGAVISVDDAGSGYAGLSHILQLHPEVLKLDSDLVAGIDTDPVRQALATALVGFAGRMGALVIAEGIEQSSQADVIRELGIGFGQGYLLGRPAPFEHWFPSA